jgi:hypothetical protein
LEAVPLRAVRLPVLALVVPAVLPVRVLAVLRLRLRVLAREFRFETLDRLLQEALDAIKHHG